MKHSIQSYKTLSKPEFVWRYKPFMKPNFWAPPPDLARSSATYSSFIGSGVTNSINSNNNKDNSNSNNNNNNS